MELFDTYIKGYDQTNRPFLLQPIKETVKKVNSIKPKGDIELKNIQYRYAEKRYIGRKQINKKIITVYAKTQKECAERLKEKIKLVLEGKTHKTEKINLVKDLYLQWFNQEKAPYLAQGTKDDILLVYKKIEPLHDLNIKRINKQSLIEFFSKMEDGRPKEKTLIYLNAFFKYYFDEGVINVNPCANVKVKKSYNRKQAFTYEEQVKILENIKGKPLYPIIMTYLLTGLRKSEMNFKSIEKDIDFENCLLKALNLKGRNCVKRYKTIKLTRQAIKLIMNNIDIFHAYSVKRVYKEFSELMKELNINGSIVNLRHTFATNCFYLKKQDIIISREMGHSQMQITKDIYTDVDYHLSEEKIFKLYNNLYNRD